MHAASRWPATRTSPPSTAAAATAAATAPIAQSPPPPCLHPTCRQEGLRPQVVEEELAAPGAKGQQVVLQLHAAHALVVVGGGHRRQLSSAPAGRGRQGSAGEFSTWGGRRLLLQTSRTVLLQSSSGRCCPRQPAPQPGGSSPACPVPQPHRRDRRDRRRPPAGVQQRDMPHRPHCQQVVPLLQAHKLLLVLQLNLHGSGTGRRGRQGIAQAAFAVGQPNRQAGRQAQGCMRLDFSFPLQASAAVYAGLRQWLVSWLPQGPALLTERTVRRLRLGSSSLTQPSAGRQGAWSSSGCGAPAYTSRSVTAHAAAAAAGGSSCCCAGGLGDRVSGQ